ncbi:GHKL domain-containing protein [Dorea longicatena]|uniref:GHKL domain-containing protein n=1 Tax=Dorea longicatena TaxID=88431 RepID=A0A414SWE2_9FIRM|nr:GHKL domain-containing protein [Dorea longicatena]RHG26275.1 GHKL domain-containing protein [Dorea longicatena]
MHSAFWEVYYARLYRLKQLPFSFSYYCALAERNTIPFHVQIDLPAQISVDETDFCLVLSNLLENALEASLKTAKFRQRIDIKIYRHASNLICFY